MRWFWVVVVVLVIVVSAVVLARLTRNRSQSSGPTTMPAGTPAWSPEPSGYSQKVQRINALLERGPTEPPSEKDAKELFNLVRHDPDFRIRVRAMSVLPLVREREAAIDVLIAALSDREGDSSGSGNVPSYAAKYLADMKATRAADAVADWVSYLETQKPYRDQIRALELKAAKESLATLTGRGHPAASQPIAGDRPSR